MKRKDLLYLLLPTLAALLIQGYHLGTDDSAIYLPSVKRVFDPGLYPFGSEFFLTHSKLSIFAYLLGGSARLLHLPVNLAIFLWQAGGVFLLMVAGWRVACLCFVSSHARWCAVLVLAMVLAVPVAGTALVIADPYFTTRTLSTPGTIMAIASFLERRRLSAICWLVFTALIHPQMAVYGFGFLLFLSLPWAWLAGESALPGAFSLANRLPNGFNLHPSAGAYRKVLYTRSFFFVSRWQWYEWIGVFAPLGILFWFTRIRPRAVGPAFQQISRTLIPFALFSTAVAVIFSSFNSLESFARLQPMRSFHLLYVIFFLLLGGLIGEYMLERRTWRWLAFFLPLAAGMYYVAIDAYPASRHIELPGLRPRNEWVAAFEWVRDNTPKNAVFALNPMYLALRNEDQHGFRAIAERSQLADYVKDSGVVSLFPALTEDWEKQQQAQEGWTHFQLTDYQRLARQYPVTWVVVEQTSSHSGLECPYSNSQVLVCRIPAAGNPVPSHHQSDTVR